MKRRQFIHNVSMATVGIGIAGITACNTKGEEEDENTDGIDLFFKLSLAQWSLHKALFDGTLNPYDFAPKAQELGFSGLEYVNAFYAKEFDDDSGQLTTVKSIVRRLTEQARDHEQENLIFMVDEKQDLAVPNKNLRLQGIEEHQKWLDIADGIGCHSIRTNLFGFEGTPEQQAEWAADSLRMLCEAAKPAGLNVIIENHGWLSSDPNWLTSVIKNVNMENCGTLPDFGNFCVKRKEGERWGECIEEYPDIYEAIDMMMPYAKGVSAKSYAFDADGYETKLDYKRIMQIVKDSGYKGYVGVEFEGEEPEEQGIIKTRDLLLKVAGELK